MTQENKELEYEKQRKLYNEYSEEYDKLLNQSFRNDDWFGNQNLYDRESMISMIERIAHAKAEAMVARSKMFNV